MRTLPIAVCLSCATLVFSGIGVWQWLEGGKKADVLEEAAKAHTAERAQLEKETEASLRALSEKMRSRIEEITTEEQAKTEAVREREKSAYDTAMREIQALGESPMLDALREAYGDGVTRWTASKVFVKDGMWESFSYSDGRVVFTFHNKGENRAALKVGVTFFNKYGLITGEARYDMGSDIRSLFGYSGTRSLGQTVREVGCQMFLGEPAYYVVSKESIMR